MLWWEQLPGRFEEEFRKMDECTNSELRIMDGSRLPGGFGPGVFLAWEETITADSGHKYRILIVCQRNHPYSAPAAWIVEPKVGRHYHMLGDEHDNRLCLHDPHIGPNLTWVLNLRNWTCEWVHCYETREWPEDYIGGR